MIDNNQTALSSEFFTSASVTSFANQIFILSLSVLIHANVCGVLSVCLSIENLLYEMYTLNENLNANHFLCLSSMFGYHSNIWQPLIQSLSFKGLSFFSKWLNAYFARHCLDFRVKHYNILCILQSPEL